MTIIINGKYEHIASGNIYRVVCVSTLKLNGKWLVDDPMVTYTSSNGIYYSRLKSIFILKFKLKG
jgi:hypothetical protein